MFGIYKKVRIKLSERVVLFKDALPVRALGPGRHGLWGRGFTEQRFKTDELIFDAMPKVLAVIPEDWFCEVKLKTHERGVLMRDGRPVQFIWPGVTRFWTVDPTVRLEIFDTREDFPELTADLEREIPTGEYVEAKVALHERGLLKVKERYVRVLEPGLYRFWTSLERPVAVQKVNVLMTPDLVFDAFPEVFQILPKDWYQELEIERDQRAILFRDGRPTKFIGPGLVRFWTVDSTVRVELFDTREAFPELSAELASVFPSNEYTQAIIEPHERGLLNVRGEFDRVLEPGLYRFWNTVDRPVTIEKIDTRRTELAISGQELMTRDKVTLRLSISVEYAVEDVALSRRVTSVRDAVYVAAQLAARDYVASVTLDALLEGRDALTSAMSEKVLPQAREIGVRVEHIGVKDIVLPGEMKTLLNRVIEAEKEAQANVILRREETAATRSLANTAKVMTQEPVLLRLKELEAMKEIAENIAEVRVVVGADGLQSLVPAQFLGGATENQK